MVWEVITLLQVSSMNFMSLFDALTAWTILVDEADQFGRIRDKSLNFSQECWNYLQRTNSSRIDKLSSCKPISTLFS